MQYQIDNQDWYAISNPGQNVSVCLDEDDDGASGSVDCRVYIAIEKPEADKITEGKRIYKPVDNKDVLCITPKPEDAIVWARCKAGAAKVTAIESGLGTAFVQDSYIQDQHSPIVETPFVMEEAQTTLTADGAVDTYQVTVAAGHGFTGAAGEVFVIPGYFVSRVVSVATNTLNLASPLNRNYVSGASVVRGSTSLVQDGTSGIKKFRVAAITGRKFDITGLRLVFQSANAMDYTKFGGATALSLPMIARIKLSSSVYNNLFTVFNNLQMEQVCDLTITGRAPSGENGLRVDYPTQRTRGNVLRIDGTLGQEIELLVRGNQSTGNSVIEAWAYGHVVED
jgi:hypothetical protein